MTPTIPKIDAKGIVFIKATNSHGEI